MASEPLFLEPSWSFEEGLTAAYSDTGYGSEPAAPFSISIAEEQAVDSYNQSFTCTMHLTVEQAAQLRDWLSATIGTRA